MTMTRKKCWICGRPVYSKISDICRPCERAWRVLVLKERGEENIDECYGCTWKGAPHDLFPCSECRGSGKEGPDWYSPAGEPLIYRNDDIPAGETEKDSSDLISRQAAIETIARIDKTNGDTVCFTGKAIISYLNDLPSVQPKTDEENELKFYYVESIDDYWVGRRLDNFYYANWHEGLGFIWSHSKYLPWGEHIVDENTLWKEHTYPSEPIEVPFTEWIVGFVKKYFAEPKTGRDCTDFVHWMMDEVMDEENWQLNAVANGEIICRKLKKLGLLDVKDGYYVETQKTGEWKQISPARIYECSECGQNVMTNDIEAYKFCHGCGAKMGVNK